MPVVDARQAARSAADRPAQLPAPPHLHAEPPFADRRIALFRMADREPDLPA